MSPPRAAKYEIWLNDSLKNVSLIITHLKCLQQFQILLNKTHLSMVLFLVPDILNDPRHLGQAVRKGSESAFHLNSPLTSCFSLIHLEESIFTFFINLDRDCIGRIPINI